MLICVEDMVFSEMHARTPISTPLSEWLIEALAHSGLSQTALAERLDKRVPKKIDRSIINKMTLGKRVISAEEMLLISEITGFDLPSDKPDQPIIAVAGRVGAGAEIDLIDAYAKGNGLYHVPCPPQLTPHGIVAVEINGDSMEPIYRQGGVVFYSRDVLGVPTEARNQICIAEDESGKVWLKHVRPNKDAEGLFDLMSLNPKADTIFGARLEWAAPIRLYLPPELVVKVE